MFDNTMPARQRLPQPSLWPSFGRKRQTPARHDETPMRARTDASIFAVAPIDQIVTALGARPGMVRNFIGRKASIGCDLPRDIIELARQVRIGRPQLSRLVQRVENGAGLYRELVQGQMVARGVDHPQ